MDAEKNWQRGEGDDALALSRAADSIDADRGNDDTPDEVSLRRKTHLTRGYKEFVIPVREVRLRQREVPFASNVSARSLGPKCL